MSARFDPVEVQIREARERAEMFAASLKKAREQEAIFEKERQRWVQTFEEKSIIIEQLERELESTVEALNEERIQEKVAAAVVVAAEAPSSSQVNTPDSRSGSTPPALGQHRAIAANGSSATSRQAEMSNILDLLQQTQEETNRAKKETAIVRAEKDRLQEVVSSAKRQIDRLTEDRDQLITACRNADGKLQFRSEQVMNYEREKERMLQRESELTKQMSDLENELATERSELAALSSDLRAANVLNARLEQRIVDLSREAPESSSTAIGPSAVEQGRREREEHWSNRLEEERRRHQTEQLLSDDMVRRLQKRLEEVVEDTDRERKTRVVSSTDFELRPHGVVEHAVLSLGSGPGDRDRNNGGGDKKAAPIHRWQHHKGDADAFSSDDDEQEEEEEDHDLQRHHHYDNNRNNHNYDAPVVDSKDKRAARGHAASVLDLDTSVESNDYHQYTEYNNREQQRQAPETAKKPRAVKKDSAAAVRASIESATSKASNASRVSDSGSIVSKSSLRRSADGSIGKTKMSSRKAAAAADHNTAAVHHRGNTDKDKEEQQGLGLDDSRVDMSLSTIGLASVTKAATRKTKKETKKVKAATTKRPSSAPAASSSRGGVGRLLPAGSKATATSTAAKMIPTTSTTAAAAFVFDQATPATTIGGRNISIHSVPAIKRGRTVPAFPTTAPATQIRPRSAATPGTLQPSSSSTLLASAAAARSLTAKGAAAAVGASSSSFERHERSLGITAAVISGTSAVKKKRVISSGTNKKTAKSSSGGKSSRSDTVHVQQAHHHHQHHLDGVEGGMDHARYLHDEDPEEHDVADYDDEQDEEEKEEAQLQLLHQQFLQQQTAGNDDDHSRGSRGSRGSRSLAVEHLNDSHASSTGAGTGTKSSRRHHHHITEGHTGGTGTGGSRGGGHGTGSGTGKMLQYTAVSKTAAVSSAVPSSPDYNYVNRQRHDIHLEGRYASKNNEVEVLDTSLASLSTASGDEEQEEHKHISSSRIVSKRKAHDKSASKQKPTTSSATKRAASVDRRSADRYTINGNRSGSPSFRSASPAPSRPLSAPLTSPGGRRPPGQRSPSIGNRLHQQRHAPRLSEPTFSRATTSLTELANSIGIAITHKSTTPKQRAISRRSK